MITKYYLTERAKHPVNLSQGTTINFELCSVSAGMYLGVFSTDDASIIEALTPIVADPKSGITEIDKAEYNQMIGKKKPLHSSLTTLEQPTNLQQVILAGPPKEAEAVEPVEQEDGDERESTFTKDELSEVSALSEDIGEEASEAVSEYATSYRQLAEFTGESEDKLKDLAKTEGAPKRDPKKGHNVDAWVAYLKD